MQQLATQRRQFGDLLLRLQFLAFAGGNLIGRRHQQHVTDLSFVQALGFQHQVQRLIPRHVLQAQGNAALHRVAGHQIEVGEIGDQLQHRAHVNVLEVQRELFTGVGKTLGVALLQVVYGHRADADGQLVVGLIGRVIERAAGLNADGRPVSRGAGVDELHRRGEILDVQTDPQRFRQLGPGETDDNPAIALLNVRGDGRIREIDDHIAFTLGAALEIHAADRLAHRRIDLGRRGSCRGDAWRLGCGCRCRCRCGGCVTGSAPDHHKQVIAFDTSGVRGQLSQVDDQPRAVLGFHHRGTAGIATAQVASLAR